MSQIALSCLMLVALVNQVASAQTVGPADPWTPVTDWEPVVSDEVDKAITRLVRARVRQMIKPAPPPEFLYDYAGQSLEFGALRSLALMAALPRLARQDASSDDTPENRLLFQAARESALAGIQPVLEVALPEYWAAATGAADPKVHTLREIVGREHARGSERLKFFLEHRAYGVSVVLMSLEFYFSGGTQLEFETGRQPSDRAARPAASLTPEARLGIARLATLLLLRHSKADDYNAEFAAPLADGALYTYDLLGASPDATCLSKTSTALMGLRAALALGVTDFPEESFRFGLEQPGQPLTKAKFLGRLSDVLVHCVVTTSGITTATDPKAAIGVVGRQGFAATSPDREAAAPPESPVNILEYQPRFARDAVGRPIIRILRCLETAANPAATLLPDDQHECAYRYLPGDHWRYGAYHTAGGGYTLATSLSALPLVWQAAAKPGTDAVVAGIYPVTAAPIGGRPAWKVKVKDQEHTVTLDPQQPLTPVTFGDLPVRQRLAQALNFILRQTTSGDSPAGPRKLNLAERSIGEARIKHMDAVLSILPAQHSRQSRGIGVYGIFKFLLSVGCPDAAGNWRAFPDLVKWLDDAEYSGFVGQAHWAHNEFLILTVTRSYRPLYGRDSP